MKEQLTIGEQIINAGYWLSRPVACLFFLHFCHTINARRRNSRRLAWPVTIRMEANVGPSLWAQKDVIVRSFHWGEHYTIEGGRKHTHFSLAVSSSNARWAYGNLAQRGWQINSPPIH